MQGYRIQLLGKLQVDGAETTLTRFRTRKTALLLAYLAYHSAKPTPRDVLIEIVWPELDVDAGRNNLSTALSSLRRQLEPPGMASGAVLLADRQTVQLRPEAIVTDVSEFENALRAAEGTTNGARAGLLEAAMKRYAGPLLPDYDADWITVERLRLEEAYAQARGQWQALQAEAGKQAPAAASHRRSGQDTRLPLSPPLGTVTILAVGMTAGIAEGERAPFESKWGAEPASEPAWQTPAPMQAAILQNQCRRFGGVAMPGEAGAFVALFGSAEDALECAFACRQSLDAQTHATASASSAFCMALHTGEVATEEDGQCGAARRIALRLLEAGHGGQMLGTMPLAALLQKAHSHRAAWEDLGEYRLAEGASAERIFQINAAEPSLHPFPPLRALRLTTETLPVPLNRFFGREAELARLTALLRAPYTRLVTLTGMGGTGKTRLAIEAGHCVQAMIPGLVWFVSLAGVEAANLLPHALCRTLNLPPHPAADPFEQICEFFRHQNSRDLLILDNFEALVTEGAEWLHRLLARVPNIACLLTSRQALELPGEWVQPVLPLPVPSEEKEKRRKGEEERGRQGTEENAERGMMNDELNSHSSLITQHSSFSSLSTLNPQLISCPSVQLFVNRAQAVKPDFQITPGNADAIARCCIALEGIPLAIELATARAQVMTPTEMLDALKQRFAFLTTRRRSIAPRHQTLLATLDWSYERLRPELQQFFAQCCVFRDGWTAQTAAEVCEIADTQPGTGERREEKEKRRKGDKETEDGSSTPEYRTPEHLNTQCLEWLQELQAQSFIVGRERPPFVEMRFHALETLREYGEEKLSVEARNAARNRHLACFLNLAETAALHLQGAEQAQWLARLEMEYANLRAALAWSLTDAAETGAATAEAALRLAGALGPFFQIRGYAREGRAYLQAALARAEAMPSPARAQALNEVGALAQIQGEYAQARAAYAESLAIWRSLEHEQGIANALNNLGLIAELEGDFDYAEDLYAQGMDIRAKINDRPGLAASYNNLGILKQIRRDYAEAGAWYARSLAIKRELQQWRGVASTLNNMGNTAHAQRDYAASQACHEESLEIRQNLGDKQGIAGSLNNLGMVAEKQGRSEEARGLYARSLAIKEELGDKQGIAMTLHNMANLARQQGELEAADTFCRRSLQIQQEIGDRHGMAGGLQAAAVIAHAQGLAKRSARLFAAYAGLCDALGLKLSEEEQVEQERITSELRACLGAEAFAREQAAGIALTPEQAIACALSAEYLNTDPEGNRIELWEPPKGAVGR